MSFATGLPKTIPVMERANVLPSEPDLSNGAPGEQTGLSFGLLDSPPTDFSFPRPAHSTEVEFTKKSRADSVGGEQFWGRAVRASRDS